MPATMPRTSRSNAPQPITLTVRLSEGHFAVVSAFAESWDCNLSEATRRLIERAADEFVDEQGRSMASVLLGSRVEAQDPAWVERHGGADQVHHDRDDAA